MNFLVENPHTPHSFSFSQIDREEDESDAFEEINFEDEEPLDQPTQPSAIELSEEEQIRLAIAESLQSTTSTSREAADQPEEGTGPKKTSFSTALLTPKPNKEPSKYDPSSCCRI